MSRFTKEQSISYYNATLTNSNQITYESIPAEFNQVFDNSLIESAKDYDIAVTRFCLSSQSIPFWACPIQLNQPNPNLTPYGIQLSYKSLNGNEVSLDTYEYLLWSDSNDELPPLPAYPAGDITRQIMSNGYYFSYDKHEFINMFNDAMQRALQALYAKFILIYPLDDDPPFRATVQYYRNNVPSESQKIFIPVFEFPFLSWNDSLNKFQMNIDPNNYANAGNPNEGIKIYFNNMLFPLLQFPFSTRQYNRPSNILDAYQLVVPNNPENWVLPTFLSQAITTDVRNLQLFVVSDHNTLGCFSPLQRLIFTSNTLTTKPENVQPETDFATQANPSSINGINGQKVLVDFEVDMFSTNDTNRDYIQFNQSVNNSRAIGLQNSRDDIKQLDIKVWWSDFNNNQYPVVLYAGQRFDVKIAFIPRSYIKADY
jgi:hypothetical protein